MGLSVRATTPADSAEILRLLRLLAAFEQAPDAVTLTEEIIRRDGFGETRRFEVLLAVTDGRNIGMVVLYQAYSSWRGAPTLVVHDLFVEEAARSLGAGRALLKAAAQLAEERGCCRLDVNVLQWNEPARHFYEQLGFVPLPDWLPHRLDQTAMRRLVEG